MISNLWTNLFTNSVQMFYSQNSVTWKSERSSMEWSFSCKSVISLKVLWCFCIIFWSLKAPALMHCNYMQKNEWNVSFWVHRGRKCIQVCNNMRERVLYSRLWENFSFQVKVLHALCVTCTCLDLFILFSTYRHRCEMKENDE